MKGVIPNGCLPSSPLPDERWLDHWVQELCMDGTNEVVKASVVRYFSSKSSPYTRVMLQRYLSLMRKVAGRKEIGCPLK